MDRREQCWLATGGSLGAFAGLHRREEPFEARGLASGQLGHVAHGRSAESAFATLERRLASGPERIVVLELPAQPLDVGAAGPRWSGRGLSLWRSSRRP